MYSTRFDNEARYVVTCIINQNSVRLFDTIIDTGAKYTCYRARMVSDDLVEGMFADSRFVNIGGFINGDKRANTVRFYQYSVKQFTIGNIDLGERKIWITFDERVKDNVLGMDILQSVCFLQYANEKEIHFFENRDEVKRYINK